MEAPRIFEDLHKYTNHHVATISYPKRTKPEYGAFKRSYPDSQATIPLFPSQDTHICLKQAFFKQMGGTSAHVYEGVTQGKKLAVELNCLRWGGALLHLVYQFIASSGLKPPFSVPKLRFVGAGLAVSQNGGNDTFLVEELIKDRPFVKYINNNSAKPSSFSDPGRAETARFLAFCQHVQWEQTDRQVYISDFQGRLCYFFKLQ